MSLCTVNSGDMHKGLRKHLKPKKKDSLKDKFAGPEITVIEDHEISLKSPRSPRSPRSISQSLDCIQDKVTIPDLNLTEAYRHSSNTFSVPNNDSGDSPRNLLSVSQNRPRSKRTAGILDVKEKFPFLMEKSLSASNLITEAESSKTKCKSSTFHFFVILISYQ